MPAIMRQDGSYCSLQVWKFNEFRFVPVKIIRRIMAPPEFPFLIFAFELRYLL